MKPNKVMQDFNHTGIKYAPNAIDHTAYPRWMPWAFWISVAVCTTVIGAAMWWAL
jgi:hypothetical protein